MAPGPITAAAIAMGAHSGYAGALIAVGAKEANARLVS